MKFVKYSSMFYAWLALVHTHTLDHYYSIINTKFIRSFDLFALSTHSFLGLSHIHYVYLSMSISFLYFESRINESTTQTHNREKKNCNGHQIIVVYYMCITTSIFVHTLCVSYFFISVQKVIRLLFVLVLKSLMGWVWLDSMGLDWIGLGWVRFHIIS